MRPYIVFSVAGIRGWFHWGLVFLGILTMAFGAFAQQVPKEVAPEGSFDSFEIIINRNIFDPNRRADRRKLSPEEEAAASAGNATVKTAGEEVIDDFISEQMALVGTLIDGPTAVAFFTSDNSDFKTVAQLGETVGEFRLAEIRTEHVKLESNGKTIKLPVGSRMSSQRDGEWIIAANIRPATTSERQREASPPNKESSEKPSGGTSASTASSTTESSGSDGGGGGVDDVLKKLMERRRKALEK